MTNTHPHLRSHTRRRKSGKVVTYYTYDRRPEKDTPLGTDYEKALVRWAALYHQTDTVAGTLEEVFRLWEEEALPAYTSAETKRGYAKNLRKLRTGFASATWDAIELPHLKGYLDARAGKTQANRELSLLSVIWNWARGKGYTALPWPAAGMEHSRWKNKEHAREVEVTDAMFAAVYAQADQVLRDCMDLATTTGLRLTDCRTVALPRGDILSGRASKTGKPFKVQVSTSPVLQRLVEARRAVDASHTMLLSTPAGKVVSPTILRDRWDAARERAIAAAEPDLSDQLRGLYLRDMRKRAANLADSDEAARDLLDHGDVALTTKHYRTVVKLKRTVR